jgi:molecular chaperone HtpG
MVAEKVEVVSRRAGATEAWRWTSDGKGTFSVSAADLSEAPTRGTRVNLYLLEDAKSYAERFTLERLVKAQSGHVPVPIAIIDKPDAEPAEIADGAALWTKPRSEISASDYTDFYRSIAGQFDEPALTVHYRAEGRHEFTALAFIPSSRPFDLFDPERKGRIKLYVKRVFITEDADILPRYLRFVRGLVDSADIPLNVSREMIQESAILGTIKKSVTARIITDLEKLAKNDAEAFTKIWDAFGSVIKEGIYEDYERRDQLLALSRFTSTTGSNRTLKDYVGSLRENQTAIYYLAGDDAARLETSPQLEGFKARGIEVLLLSDHVDSFWVTSAPDFEGKPFKSVTQGSADLTLIKPLDDKEDAIAEASSAVTDFIAFVKTTLGDAVADVRSTSRLTDSAVCLVASESGPDRQLEKLLAGSGRLTSTSKPILEINPRHDLIMALAALDDADKSFKDDAAHMLLDEARVLDGERPADAREFSARLGRVIARGLKP